jgi:hypothetical protein
VQKISYTSIFVSGLRDAARWRTDSRGSRPAGCEISRDEKTEAKGTCLSVPSSVAAAACSRKYSQCQLQSMKNAEDCPRIRRPAIGPYPFDKANIDWASDFTRNTKCAGTTSTCGLILESEGEKNDRFSAKFGNSHILN